MSFNDAATRHDAASYARRYFAGTITRDTFLRYFADSEDPLIHVLVDALLHEPARRGLLGLRSWWWRTRFRGPVERILEELDKGSTGRTPDERIYPRTTLRGLLFGGVLLLWAALFAAQHLASLLTEIERGRALPFWDALGRLMVIGTLALATAAGLESWIDRLRLYRSRKIPGSGDGQPE